MLETAPLRLLLDGNALVANWRWMAAQAPGAACGAAVKADGYGLGARAVVARLAAAGCGDFFCATWAEAVALGELPGGARLAVLHGVRAEDMALARGARARPVLNSVEQVARWREAGGGACDVMVDTGMNRLGLSPAEAISFASAGDAPAPALVMTHLACADTPAHPLNAAQLASFQRVRDAFQGAEFSVANSAGVFLGPDYHFDLARPGIALYGGEAVDGTANPMAPVVTLEARIVAVRDVPAGETVGYGATALPARASRIATVSVGVADGYPRAASGSGVPLRHSVSRGAVGYVAGRHVPVIGRVTMDLTTFDITDLPENAVRTGDYVSLFGNGITLDDAARSAGTIGYELLTSLGKRYERRYL